MTTSQTIKAAALQYLKRLEAGDYDGAFGMLAEDATVWIAGRGNLTKAEFVALVRSFRALVEGPMELRATSAVAEGDRVAVEVVGGAAMQGGGRYDNQYHFVFVFRGNKISAIREYMNPANAKAAWESAQGAR